MNTRTQVLINISALQRDLSVWTNAEDFDPGRFVSHPEVNIQEHHFQLVPVAGQHPGVMLAIRYVLTGLAQYFQNVRVSWNVSFCKKN